MKTSRSLHAAAVIVAAIVVTVIFAAKKPEAAPTVLPQIVITAHRVTAVPLAAVVVTGKRLSAPERTRLAAGYAGARAS